MSNTQNPASEPNRHRGLRLTIAGAVTAAGSLFVAPAVGPAPIASAEVPPIEVIKYVNDGSLPDPGVKTNVTPLSVAAGTPLTFTVEIRNLGSRTDLDLVVGDTAFLDGFVCADSGDQTLTLAAGVGDTEFCTFEMPAAEVDTDTTYFSGGSHFNSVLVFDPADNRDDAVFADAQVEIAEPSFTVEKFVNDGTFADPGILTELSDPLVVEPGTPLTFTARVTNTGPVNLFDLRVRDSDFTNQFVCPTSGDNGIALLEPGDSEDCTFDLAAGSVDFGATPSTELTDVGFDAAGIHVNRVRVVFNPDPANTDLRFPEADLAHVVLNPLSVTKTVNGEDANDGDPLVVTPGTDLEFGIEVENLSNAELTDVPVRDDVFTNEFDCGGGSANIASLPATSTALCLLNVPGADVDFGTGPFDANGLHRNNGRATWLYQPEVDGDIVRIRDADEANVQLEDPMITVKKYVNDGTLADPGLDAQNNEDPLLVPAGTELTFTVDVTNNGTVDLLGVEVLDNVLPGPYDCDGDNVVDIPAGDTLSCTYVLAGSEVDFGTGTFDGDGAHRNVARAIANPGPNQVVERDPANVQIGVFDLEVKKLVEGVDAQNNEPPFEANPGDSLTFTAEVTNTGDFELTDVEVLDNEFGDQFDCDGAGGNVIASIAVGDTETCELVLDGSEVDFGVGSFDADGAHRNVARAIFDDGTTRVVERDPANVQLIAEPDDTPEFTIVKKVNGEDANDGDPLAVDPGTELTFTAEVTNTGNVTLEDVRVRDSDFSGGFECPSTGGPVIDVLDPGASETCTFVLDGAEVDFDTGTFEGIEHNNVARAVYDLPDGSTLVARDEANVVLNAEPALAVRKFVNGEQFPDGTYSILKAGEDIEFEVRVRNAGNIDLEGVEVTDDVFGNRFDCDPDAPGVQNIVDIPALSDDNPAPGDRVACFLTVDGDFVVPDGPLFDENGVHRNEATATYLFQPTEDGEPVPVDASFEANIVLEPEFRLGNLIWFENSLPPQEFPTFSEADGDVKVEDITIELYEAGDDPGTDAPLDTTVPRPDGFYVFEGLHQGDYFVYLPDLPEGTIVAQNGSTDPNNNLNNNRDHNALPSNSAVTEPITLDFDFDPSQNPPITGNENTGNGFTNSTLDLALRQLPELELEKEVDATRSNPDGTYDVRYLITVSNTGPGATQYQLNDELLFGAGLDLSGATVSAEAVDPELELDSPPINPAFDGQDETRIIRGRTLPGGSDIEPSTHSYFVTVQNIVVDPAMTLDARDCELQRGEEGRTGGRNLATLQAQFLDETLEAEDCRPVPEPELLVTKSVIANEGDPAGAGPEFGDDGFEQIADDGTFVVTYEIVVDNIGRGPGVYDLTDELQFGEGIAIDSVEVSETTPAGLEEATWDGRTELLLGDDNAIDGTDNEAGVQQHRYVIVVTGDASAVASDTRTNDQCQLRGDVSVGGFQNLATLDYFGIVETDDACADDPAEPGVRKAVQDGPTLVTEGPATGKYIIDYLVGVSNGGGSGEYTLDDIFQFGSGMTADRVAVTVMSDDDADVTANLNPGYDGTGDTSVLSAPQFIEPGGLDVFMVRALVSIDPVVFVPAGEGECPDVVDEGARGGFLNVAIATVGDTSVDVARCERVPDPDLSFAKGFADLEEVDNPEDLGGGQWRVTYDLVVTNSGDGVDLYDLDDELLFGAGIEEGDVTVVSVTGVNSLSDDDDATDAPIAVNAGWNGYSDTSVVAGQPILGQETHTYRIVVEVDAMVLESRDAALCADDGAERGGFLNVADLAASTLDAGDFVCADIPLPELVLDKTVTSGPTLTAVPGQYDITYEVDVDNIGPGSGIYDLFDDLRFGDGITVVSAEVTSADVATDLTGWAGAGQIVDDEPIAADGDPGDSHTYTIAVRADVAPGTTVVERDCAPSFNTGRTGLLNESGLTYPFGELEADDCAPIPNSDIVMSKFVSQSPQSVDGTTYEMTYQVWVTNRLVSIGEYDLDDELMLGAGVDITSVMIESDDVDVTGTDWDGVDVVDVIDGVAIQGFARHEYLITVEFTLGAELTDTSADCTLDDGEDGTGSLNTATITVLGESSSDDDCVPVGAPELDVDKAVSSGPVEQGDGSYEVGYQVVVTNTGDAPGTYDLEDDPDFGPDISISSATVTSGDVTLPEPATWDPDSDANTVIEGAVIPAGGTHTYTFTFVVTVDDPALVESGTECSGGESELFNSVDLIAGDTVLESDACAEIPPPPPPPVVPPTIPQPGVPTVPTVPIVPPVGTLPETGSNATQTGIMYAMMLLAGGLALAIAARRRRADLTTD